MICAKYPNLVRWVEGYSQSAKEQQSLSENGDAIIAKVLNDIDTLLASGSRDEFYELVQLRRRYRSDQILSCADDQDNNYLLQTD